MDFLTTEAATPNVTSIDENVKSKAKKGKPEIAKPGLDKTVEGSVLSPAGKKDAIGDIDTDNLFGYLKGIDPSDYFNTDHPDGSVRKALAHVEKVKYAAISYIKKASDKSYAQWEVFKAMYGSNLKRNAWTGEIYFKGKETSPESLINQFEDIFKSSSRMTTEQYERRLGGVLGKGYNPVEVELTQLVRKNTETVTVSRVATEQEVELLGYEPGEIVELPEQRLKRVPEWDRIASVLFGVPEDDILSQKMVQKWLIAMVARGMEPGCQADNVLVLKGKQGIGKTTFFRVLGGQFYSALSHDTNELEQKRQLSTSWVVELGELEAISRKADVESLKAFISDTKDTYRGLYERKPSDHQRHVVFGGTCNSSEILRDPTGSRRFWVIECEDKDINIEYLKANRELILVTAYDEYLNGTTWYADKTMTAASEERNKAYQVTNEYEEPVSQIVSVLEQRLGGKLEGKEGIAIKLSDLMTAGLGIALGQHQEKRRDMKVSEVLTSLGYIKKRVGSAKLTVWVKPENKNPDIVTAKHIQDAKEDIANGHRSVSGVISLD